MKQQKKNIGRAFLFGCFLLALLLISSDLQAETLNTTETPLVSNVHDPIIIDGDGDFTSANGVGEGTGVETDPFIIEGWVIDGAAANGIFIQNTEKYLIIRNCEITNFGEAGIKLDGVMNVVIENNLIDQGDNGPGISLQDTQNIDILENDVRNAEIGILVQESIEVEVIENIFAYCTEGIQIQNTDSSKFVYNIVAENSDYGINVLGGCNDNNIYKNNFIENGINTHCSSAPAANLWYVGTTGNYYSDYEELHPQATHNGQFWSITYNIPGDAQDEDKCPLIGPTVRLPDEFISDPVEEPDPGNGNGDPGNGNDDPIDNPFPFNPVIGGVVIIIIIGGGGFILVIRRVRG